MHTHNTPLSASAPLSDWEIRAEEERLEAARIAASVARTQVAPVVARESAAVALPETDDVRELARAATPVAVRALVEIVGDEGASASARISAATALLDRGHGKPHQSHEVTGSMSITVQCAIPAPPNSIERGVVINNNETEGSHE